MANSTIISLNTDDGSGLTLPAALEDGHPYLQKLLDRDQRTPGELYLRLSAGDLAGLSPDEHVSHASRDLRKLEEVASVLMSSTPLVNSLIPVSIDVLPFYIEPEGESLDLNEFIAYLRETWSDRPTAVKVTEALADWYKHPDVPIGIVVDSANPETPFAPIPIDAATAWYEEEKLKLFQSQIDKLNTRTLLDPVCAPIKQPSFLDARGFLPGQTDTPQVDLLTGVYPQLQEMLKLAPDECLLVFQNFLIAKKGDALRVLFSPLELTSMAYPESLRRGIQESLGGLPDAPYWDCEGGTLDKSINQLLGFLEGTKMMFPRPVQPEQPTIAGPQTENQEKLIEYLVNSDRVFYIKGSISSGGREVLRLSRDDNGNAVLETSSEQILHMIDKHMKHFSRITDRLEEFNTLRAMGDDVPEWAIRDNETSKRRWDITLPNILSKILASMELPIIEEEIPFLRRGEDRVELRAICICQGTTPADGMEFVADYFKVSANPVAANISIAGHGEKTEDVLKDLYRARFGEDRLDERVGDALLNLRTEITRIAQFYADKRGRLDFAVDIVPAWDKDRGDIVFYLLEVQDIYGYSGLAQCAPALAEAVTERKAGLRARLVGEKVFG